MVDYRYLPRVAAGLLERALAVSPVVVLMGTRQTGKSTLAQSEPFLEDRFYLTLDDLKTRDRARMAGEDLVRSAPRLILDEVQREPDLLLAVKRAVDEERPAETAASSSPAPPTCCSCTASPRRWPAPQPLPGRIWRPSS